MFPHDFPFDPTYGYAEHDLLKIAPPTPPEDFEAFWRTAFAQALEVPTHHSQGEWVCNERKGIRICDIWFDAMGLAGRPAVRIGGWLVMPADGALHGAEVVGHGYGGREEPNDVPRRDGVARLFICKRGFHRSFDPTIPHNDSSRHVVTGIGARETYVHLGNAADLWAAVTVMGELFPQLAARIDYSGASFGGGIGALAMPWDHRVRRVFLDVPSFGNHPVRLQCPCVGSGEAVRQLHLAGHVVLPVLNYFDAASAARFMDKPTLVGCARFDPAVPPPGQFSVYNAIPSEKKLVMRDAGHFDYPSAARDYLQLYREVDRWLSTD